MAMICQGPGDKPCLRCAHCEKARRGIHPDIVLYDREDQTRTIYVDQIRALRDDAVIMPNEARRKVYIIRHAGSMNVSAQNALLKVLEEPPGGAAFILTAETPEQLLPTVRSRCAQCRPRPSGLLTTGMYRDLLKNLSRPCRTI
jgi:DNA polymerase-3 subunit delta'